MVAGVVAAGCIASVIRLALSDIAGALLVLLIPITLSIPISLAFRAPEGWRRWVAIAALTGMFLLGLPRFISLAADVDLVPSIFLGAYFIGIFILSFLGQFLLYKR